MKSLLFCSFVWCLVVYTHAKQIAVTFKPTAAIDYNVTAYCDVCTHNYTTQTQHKLHNTQTRKTFDTLDIQRQQRKKHKTPQRETIVIEITAQTQTQYTQKHNKQHKNTGERFGVSFAVGASWIGCWSKGCFQFRYT